MRIECGNCAMYRTQHCDDCLVTALLSPEADTVDIDEGLDRPLEALSDAGLIPVLKFRPRVIEDPDDQAPEASAG